MSLVGAIGLAMSVIAKPDWVVLPDAAAVERAYPPMARAEGRSGQARLLCDVAPDGGVNDCAVEREEPAGFGFGAAARVLARDLRLSREQTSGKVRFDLALEEEGADSPGYPAVLLLRYRGPWPPPDEDGAELDFGVCPNADAEREPHGCRLREVSWTIPPAGPFARATQGVMLQCRLSPTGTPTECRRAVESETAGSYDAKALAPSARLDPALYAGWTRGDVWLRFTVAPIRPAHAFRVEIRD